MNRFILILLFIILCSCDPQLCAEFVMDNELGDEIELTEYSSLGDSIHTHTVVLHGSGTSAIHPKKCDEASSAEARGVLEYHLSQTDSVSFRNMNSEIINVHYPYNAEGTYFDINMWSISGERKSRWGKMDYRFEYKFKIEDLN